MVFLEPPRRPYESCLVTHHRRQKWQEEEEGEGSEEKEEVDEISLLRVMAKGRPFRGDILVLRFSSPTFCGWQRVAVV